MSDSDSDNANSDHDKPRDVTITRGDGLEKNDRGERGGETRHLFMGAHYRLYNEFSLLRERGKGWHSMETSELCSEAGS